MAVTRPRRRRPSAGRSSSVFQFGPQRAPRERAPRVGATAASSRSAPLTPTAPISSMLGPGLASVLVPNIESGAPEGAPGVAFDQPSPMQFEPSFEPGSSQLVDAIMAEEPLAAAPADFREGTIDLGSSGSYEGPIIGGGVEGGVLNPLDPYSGYGVPDAPTYDPSAEERMRLARLRRLEGDLSLGY